MTVNIHPLGDDHLDKVWQIERQAHAYPWSESLIRKPASKIGFNRVLLVNDEVVGYFYAQHVAGEATLLNVAVSPQHQGKGYGRQLVEAFLEQSKTLGGEEAWLEVRASNQGAYFLYEKLGFNEINRRENYYPSKDGREDALIMTCLLLDDTMFQFS
ncbi:ribosomal protein S18-alanine N-acetyltransferase [Thaumasiovibrio subtropicus]|uniref:ribosomal protein S18-alanine N-acetyltransferase n=1 Tax=Thaumasiovibrio subtropicus TaxID=1891207 RepID=UPI000B358AEC|nr:ribosomal protein S18-alanine N-acetyltransferase [Thaumasiovibrio subtropicus]